MPVEMPTPSNPMRIGTRGSRLALVQAQMVRDKLGRELDVENSAFEILPIRTTGDKILGKPLREVGGKGLFCREIEECLLAGRVDIAVHSMKDMPVEQPAGLVIDCTLPRDDPRDALVTVCSKRVVDLPDGTIVGTSSVRRKAQVLRANPRVRVEDIRGNLETRLAKLNNGLVQATLLAMAGLARAENKPEFAHAVSLDEMLPAAAQGIICVERRSVDLRAAAMLEAINDEEASIASVAERTFLALLDGYCEMPIGAYAALTNEGLLLRGEVLRPDGADWTAGCIAGSRDDAALLGQELADSLLRSNGEGFFSSFR
ncbi:MAG: hydroxymethylbilane synthase [Albidovulum sp.]|nr:hydroxymethylbilane synthase [Albidovulum sp.]MDE0304283.1 hydroxymethylbilane synthase [Albidovulum sp.]